MEAATMDITMQNGKSSNYCVGSSKNPILWLITLLFFQDFAYADLDVSAGVTSSNIYQNVKSEDRKSVSLNTFSINPSLNVSYESRTLRGRWQTQLTYLKRDRDDINIEDNFQNYAYSAQWSPLDDLITFEASGALSYQNAQPGNFLVSDFNTNANSLAKTRSNRLASTLNIREADWIQVQGMVSYSDVASERAANGQGNALNNDTYQLSGTARNGDRAKKLIWQITGSYQNTSRAQLQGGEFISRNASGFSDFNIIGNWAIRLSGTHEANQISDRIDSLSATREFNTFGAGITYRQTANRFISLTANRTNTEQTEDDSDNFVGVDLQWAFTPRTSASLTYGRRFFGETGSANIRYNSKYLRSAFIYTENVTNTSRLLANPENIGVFVCPINSTSISNCFQPNNLNYVPASNEQFVQFSNQNVEFSDNIIVRKSSNLQLGYDFSRITVGLSFTYSEDDALDANRLLRTLSSGITLSYQIGSYTNANASISYANVDQQSDGTNNNGESDNWNFELGITRSIGRNLNFSSDISYIKRAGDDVIGGGFNTGLFGANFTDRRISVSLTYTYD
ncbi:TIGR03016 family PEP-CTERM system-associated outer membrane protein [Alteromonas hispanica]|uniref:TIGR03016 family PEP-CTERM system-associated outer membrane protein n=1 Tax=Alteromonas hispanica TaxID=315421 RepID=A0A6L9MTP9_9ALTE|nr:TIGR03016 family PEP-CTERM system-associated outer membrane protein [Alteromonas hispanica]NDW21629.1 TIGR03016 family PEP-CTERM system-associated outer membrane protein [Alteromonas hispanica]